MKYEQEQEVLRFSFEGEFDNLSVMRIKDESIALIERFHPKVLKLDFADVTFVDSSGIGYVLARYQQLRKWQGEVVLCNLTRLNQTIFEMSGIFQVAGNGGNTAGHDGRRNGPYLTLFVYQIVSDEQLLRFGMNHTGRGRTAYAARKDCHPAVLVDDV